MRMSRRMALNSQCGGKIEEPLYTGNYTITQIGGFIYMYLLTSGTLTIQSKGEYDLFCVGAGGAGGVTNNGYGSGGGGGGYTVTQLKHAIAGGSDLSVTIGGGAIGSDGGTTSVIGTEVNISASGGKKGNGGSSNVGGDGGSGGGGGARGAAKDSGGSGGSNGNNGVTGSKTGLYLNGGTGQGTTTKAFGEDDQIAYSGGGGGFGGTDSEGLPKGGGSGGVLGGGKGIQSFATGKGAVDGTANTGGGGGAGANLSRYTSRASGGSGLAIIRWKAA